MSVILKLLGALIAQVVPVIGQLAAIVLVLWAIIDIIDKIRFW